MGKNATFFLEYFCDTPTDSCLVGFMPVGHAPDAEAFTYWKERVVSVKTGTDKHDLAYVFLCYNPACRLIGCWTENQGFYRISHDGV